MSLQELTQQKLSEKDEELRVLHKKCAPLSLSLSLSLLYIRGYLCVSLVPFLRWCLLLACFLLSRSLRCRRSISLSSILRYERLKKEVAQFKSAEVDIANQLEDLVRIVREAQVRPPSPLSSLCFSLARYLSLFS